MPEPAENPAPTPLPANPVSGEAIVPPSPRSSLLLGNDGLRIGWRLAIYAAAYYALREISLIVVGAFSDSRQTVTLWAFLASEVLLLVAAVVPAFWLSHFEERPFDDYGLPHRHAFDKNFWAGALWGLCAITCLVLMLRAAGVLHFEGIVLHGFRVVKFAVFWSVVFLAVACYEDFLFRGYSQFTLAQGIGFWPAAFFLSALFGAVHLGNPGEHWNGALGAGCIGLFFCLTLRRTGSLWFAIGMHAVWDWGETFLYSVPDSGLLAPGHLVKCSLNGPAWLTGGSVGPEGSVLLFVLTSAMWVLFDRIYPARKSDGSELETKSGA